MIREFFLTLVQSAALQQARLRVDRGVQNISLVNIGKIARALRVKLVDIFRRVH